MSPWELDRTREPRPRNPFGVVPPPFTPEPPRREFDPRPRKYDPVSGCFLLVDIEERAMWRLVDAQGRLRARFGHCTLEEARAEAVRRRLAVLEDFQEKLTQE